MRDGIRLTRRGIPSVVFITQVFEDEADFVARAAGIPANPRVVLPHPAAGIGEEQLRKLADGVAASVAEMLKGREGQ